MPKAHITAVDKDPHCVEVAEYVCAVADHKHGAGWETICCDLSEWQYRHPRKYPTKALMDREAFDIVNLDLCAGPNQNTKDLAGIYPQLLSRGGIFMMTFSYGRDVIEMFADAFSKAKVTERDDGSVADLLEEVTEIGGELISGRLLYLFSPARLQYLRSVILYRGSEMPMCSLLFQAGTGSSRYTRAPEPISAVRLEPGDFEIAVTHPDPTLLYHCPMGRIDTLRRKHAAIKASYTRSKKRENS